MGKLLFLLFTVVPFIELFLLLKVGGAIGFWPTVGGIVLTGFIGATLARREGARVLRSYQETLRGGRVPEEGVLGAVLILVGGVLLVAPGVLTDLVGLLLLIPPSRKLVAKFLRRRLERSIANGTVRVSFGGLGGFGGFGGFRGAGPQHGPDKHPPHSAEPTATSWNRVQRGSEQASVTDAEVVDDKTN